MELWGDIDVFGVLFLIFLAGRDLTQNQPLAVKADTGFWGNMEMNAKA